MKKENKKYLRQVFEVITPLDDVTDEETLKKEFNGDIKKAAEFLYAVEGIWWKEEMNLIKAEIINVKMKKIKGRQNNDLPHGRWRFNSDLSASVKDS